MIPLINCGLGALQVKRTVVELTASACTFPGGTVGTDANREKEKRGDNSEEVCGRAEGRTPREKKKEGKKRSLCSSPASFIQRENPL